MDMQMANMLQTKQNKMQDWGRKIWDDGNIKHVEKFIRCVQLKTAVGPA